MAAQGHRLRRHCWRCHACGPAGMDSLASRLPLLSLQGLPESAGRRQGKHTDTRGAQHAVLRLHEVHFLANHGRHAAFAKSSGRVLSGTNGQRTAMVRILVVCGATNDSMAVLYLPAGHAQRRPHTEGEDSIGRGIRAESVSGFVALF